MDAIFYLCDLAFSKQIKIQNWKARFNFIKSATTTFQ